MENNLQTPSYNNPLSFFDNQFKKDGLTNLSVYYLNNYTVATSAGISREDFLTVAYKDEVEKSLKLIHSYISKQSSLEIITIYLNRIIGEIKDLYIYLENIKLEPSISEILEHALKDIIKSLSIKYEQYLPQLQESTFFDGWISDSMEVFNPQQQISSEELTAKENDFKITLNLSVPQIALFARVLNEVDLIDAKFKTHIYRHIQAYFSSKSQEHISVANIKNQWGDPSDETITDLLAFLNEMKIKLSEIKKSKQK